MIASTFPIIPCSTEETIAKETGLNVIIDKHGVKKLAEEVIEFMSDNKYTSCTRQLPKLYPSFFDIKAGDWLFLLHTLNFSLWIPNSTKQWTVNNYTGFWALCAAIKRAIDDNKLIWDPNYYMTITPTEMKYIFRGDDEIILPYLEERRIILHRVGKILKKKYGVCAVALKERDAQRRSTERTEMELGRSGAEMQSSAVECYYGGVG
ncbi:PREDICTED: UPF0553 protein v1g230591-like [Acromyrmex echinatior]|uniref:UPF0553 protein v1g230591-like n=1 Tax=Acromyrmex echinatior TaxID=103372 RepID=UPI000581093B|nr:PREDICTED: UPF0553 protein v1g230591-like [Acromyrmex echinatior]